jgi:LacI family transcriptional regulator
MTQTDHSPASGPAGGAGNGTSAKRVSIREIARQAEVSVATVSMVLNGNPKITPATQQRVQQVVDRLGYRPNRAAQSLSGKYTNMLAVLMPTLRHALADFYFGELISGICDRATRLGHTIILESAKPNFIRERRHIELFERRFVDGVLCLGFGDKHHFLADFTQPDYPAMLVNNLVNESGLDHVWCDYPGGAQQAMRYLLQLGHQRIGLIHGASEVYSARQVQAVYEQELTAAAGPPPADWMVDGRFTEEHGYEAAEVLLQRDPQLTALFAGNDKMAIGAMHYLINHGWSVPGDISVIGCDDIKTAAYCNPSLTTVHLPLYEVGATACERLINHIRGNDTTEAQCLSTHLVLRESTGRAPQR